MNDDQKAVYLALAVSALESICADEYDINPKSARYRAIDGLIERSLKAIDMYRMEAMKPDKLTRIGAIIDKLQVLLMEEGL